MQELLVHKPKHTKLFARLRKHAASIGAVNNLRLGDFKCRYMLVDEIWVALGEARLVALFTPVWNVLVEGFGSNVEGGGRERTARSVWDILHPGRKDSLAIQVAPSWRPTSLVVFVPQGLSRSLRRLSRFTAKPSVSLPRHGKKPVVIHQNLDGFQAVPREIEELLPNPCRPIARSTSIN